MVNQDTFYEFVGRRIRELREERKLTQSGLADLVHLTRTSIANVERGKQKLLLHTFCDIAEALTVKPSVLLPETMTSIGSHQLEPKLPDGYSSDEKEWMQSIIAGSKEGD